MTGFALLSALSMVLVVATPAVGAPTGGPPADAGVGMAALSDHGEDTYSVVQGDRCVQIEPLGDGGQTPEDHYDYRNPNTSPSSYAYSSQGTTHLQEDDTSILYLHEGRDGLSLVIVHDRYGGFTDGGAATFYLENLSEDGEWVVEDDNYDGADAEWEHGEDWSRITWAWAEGRTDGGVFTGGMDDEFAIEITPRFNELADFQVNEGEVTDWQVLSAPEHDPERTSLDLHEPIVVRSGGCTAVTDVDVNRTATVGEEVEVTATVVNEGTGNETVTVPFAIEDEVVDTQELDLEPGEEVTISTTGEFRTDGERTVSVDEASATVEVSEPEVMSEPEETSEREEIAEQTPGFDVLVAAGALLVALALLSAVVLRRRR